MGFKTLPQPLRGYILLHLVALVPVAVVVAQLPAPGNWPLAGVLLLASAVAGIWRIELTLRNGRQSLVFAVACLALLLQGVQAAVLCASLGALLTHLVRPSRPWWRLQYFSQPVHRRVFNVVHCALACALAALIAVGSSILAAEGWARELSGLVVFASAYFLINTFGVATAIALEQQQSPIKVWKEHCFWMAPVYFLSAGVAGGIAVAFRLVGASALLLLPCFYLVFLAYRTYIDTLRKQRELLAEINRLYAQEEEANRRKDEFLAALAHELRNPLAAIANAQYLLERLVDGGRAERPIETIGRQTRHLQRLIDDLLDVSRITRGVIELRLAQTDLRKVLQGATEAVLPLIHAKHHRLHLDIPDAAVCALVDPDRMEQIFVNLLGNAAKYTDPEGEIVASLGVEGDEVVFRVRDNGLGIDPEELPKIFELFIQEKRSLGSSEGGLGIGLTLVKRLVDLHDGQIEAFSAGPHCGSEFTVRLARVHAADSPDTEGGPVDQAASEPPPARVTVLIAEDQDDAAETLEEIIDLWGYAVVLARNGPQALELARTEHPDIGILDIGLPGMDGYSLARKLRDEGSTAVLIAATGHGQPADREAALKAGFDYHQVKPIDLDELRSLLKKAEKRSSN